MQVKVDLYRLFFQNVTENIAGEPSKLILKLFFGWKA